MPGIKREAAAGAIAGFATDAVLYPLDAHKTHKQYFPSGSPGIRWNLLYRGFLPVLVTGAGPCYGTFFAVNESVKYLLTEKLGLSQSFSVFPSSVAAAFPAAMVYVPADTIKKRAVTGMDTSGLSAIRTIAKTQGISGFYVGWRANMARDIPFTTIKMCFFQQACLLYQWVRRPKTQTRLEAGRNRGNVTHGNTNSNAGKNRSSNDSDSPTSPELSPTEAGWIGCASGMATAVVTNPIDVVNTRIKTHPTTPAPGVLAMASTIVRAEGVPALFSGLAPRVVFKGLTGLLFWGMHRRVSNFLGSVLEEREGDVQMQTHRGRRDERKLAYQ
mmetsp:Transcript_14831/g.20787  ORF Transcript_14831/g.20787 Transcript_14831/m.20787 type:complete len:329 (-) Transcript_14831:162-1148(-)|eukprot:CAMPEP_0184503186 /NCGR_PEP_ID=MMETSP0113_2-20130426/51743_1 /TAXON_ID=91329 /ORGANISM="Norrisiella sphaerica, Strain BC52" /LENGTH=328 /DNA_ID=CAMNT_0026892637 /DNA_START=36 /DNA_END=1022 /DNA_ORIENTATION=+